MSQRLKVLCLHGFTSNGQVHAHQIRNVVKSLPEYEFLFPSGPHEVDVKSQMNMETAENQAWADIVKKQSTLGHRAWWFARNGKWDDLETGSFHGLEKSLEYIGDYMREHGPFQAICGFSQGGCFAGMLNALLQDRLADHPLRKLLPEDAPTPLAGVIFSGFRAPFRRYDELYEPGIDVPILHVIGEKDPVVRSERGQELIKACNDPQFLIFPGGHDIPKADADRSRITQFLQSHLPTDQPRNLQASL